MGTEVATTSPLQRGSFWETLTPPPPKQKPRKKKPQTDQKTLQLLKQSRQRRLKPLCRTPLQLLPYAESGMGRTISSPAGEWRTQLSGPRSPGFGISLA